MQSLANYTEVRGSVPRMKTRLLTVLLALPLAATHASILSNGDFSSAFTNNTGSVNQGGAYNNWTRPGNHQFTQDAANEWAFVVDDSGALSTIQLVPDARVSTGAGTLSFDYWIEENTATPELRVQIIGILESDPTDGWTLSNWSTGLIQSPTGTPGPSSAFLYDQTFSGDTSNAWVNVNAAGLVNFGSGYDFIAVRISESGGNFEDPTSPDVLRVDNISLTAQPIPEPSGLLFVLAAVSAMTLTRRRRQA